MLAERTPSVSIITISKDDPAGLGATIESVRAQSYSDYELIVVRSGSSQSLDLGAGDPRLVVIDQPARGISRAFNTGVERARGEWIQFLNGGDAFLDARALQDLAAACRNDVEMVLSFAMMKGRDSTIPREALSLSSRSFLYASHQASLFRRRLFERYGHFLPQFQVRMDLEWLFRLPADTQYAFIDRRTVEYDATGVSGSRFVRSAIEEIHVLWRTRELFGRAAYIGAIVLPYRLLRHVWRQYH